MCLDVASQDGSEIAYDSEDDVFYDCYVKPDIRDWPEVGQGQYNGLSFLSQEDPSSSPLDSTNANAEPGPLSVSTDTMYNVDGPVKMRAAELQAWLKCVDGYCSLLV